MPRGRSEHANTELHPLPPLFLQILVTLADGERHGYAILREIRSRANVALDPGAGSLYGAIQKLLNEGAIEECSERPDPRLDDKRRRYYRITEFGRRIATEEVERLREVVRFADPKFPSKNLVS
jgi:DNA-binding PadR family transcriptional regulator